MEIVKHSKNSLHQQKLQKKWYHFNRNAQLSNVIQEMIQLDFQSESDKKIGPDSTQKPPNPQPCREA